MNSTPTFITQLLQAISLGTLALYAVMGALAGAVLGLVLARRLHRSGWLDRRQRWHHLGLRLYYLALPAAIGFIGLQAATLYGIQRQTYAQLELHRTELKAYSDAALVGFQQYLDTADLRELQLEKMSMKDVLRQLIDGYLARQFPAVETAGSSMFQRAGTAMMKQLQSRLISELVASQLADKAAERTGLDKDSVDRIARAPLAQLFDVDFLMGLAKRQVASTLRGFYVGLGVLLAGVLGAVCAEILLSRRMRWHRAAPAADAGLQPA